MQEFKLRPIGLLRTPYIEKFGIPRQPGLVCGDESYIEFSQDIGLEFFSGLEYPSFMFATFYFHDLKSDPRAMIRPPKMGGNKKVGVFASRSPYRVNQLGLSLIYIPRAPQKCEARLRLSFSGADMLDQTPLLDLRPYHPMADYPWLDQQKQWFHENGSTSFDQVIFSDEALRRNKLSKEQISFLESVLLQDPRPGFHDDPKRIYFFKFKGMETQCLFDDDLKIIQVIDLKVEPNL